MVNVDAAVTNVGATALEVLEKSPGVMVDKDGNISLKGKQSVMVMMDGRPTYLTGEQLANLLKSMPASSIDQIELVTNPSAKYDAEGASGILNINLKKYDRSGMNGSLYSGYTYNGKQYVTVQVGLGSVNVARMGPQLKNVPRGGSVWTFALME